MADRVVVHTAALPWQASPSLSVWRKRVELRGPKEAGRVTSIVRYDPGSRFAAHGHPQGEEIVVLEGVFSDEHGDYPGGSFLLNPEGFCHAPYSTEGCRLFVKLRQYPGATRTQLRLNVADVRWCRDTREGVSEAELYRQIGFPERIGLLRLEPGASTPISTVAGAEILLLEGELEDGSEKLREGSWGQYQSGTPLYLQSEIGACCYLKTGHLT